MQTLVNMPELGHYWPGSSVLWHVYRDNLMKKHAKQYDPANILLPDDVGDV